MHISTCNVASPGYIIKSGNPKGEYPFPATLQPPEGCRIFAVMSIQQWVTFGLWLFAFLACCTVIGVCIGIKNYTLISTLPVLIYGVHKATGKEAQNG